MIILARKVKDLPSKNFKTAKKDIEEDIRRTALSCTWISMLRIIKMANLPKAINRFNKTLSKFQNNSSQKLKNNLYLHMKRQNSQESKNSPA